MNLSRKRSILLVIAMAVAFVAGTFPAMAAGSEQAGDRLGPPKRMFADRANWVTFDEYEGVFGSGADITVVEHRPFIAMNVKSRLRLEWPATHGLLVKHHLYLVQQSESGEQITVLDLLDPGHGPTPVEIDPAPRGGLQLARMDDYLLVAEDGRGIHILKLPHSMPGHAAHHATPEPVSVGIYALETDVDAIAASLRTIYIATDRGMTIVDALNPALPTRVLHTPLAFDVHAMAANGPQVQLLGSEGLRIVEFGRNTEPVVVAHRPDARGGSIYFAGRSSYIAGGEAGLVGVEDISVQAANIMVSVGDVFFSPAGLIQVNQGDSVTWTKPSTVFSHNVESCTPALAGCSGATATEAFLSGGITTSPFTFVHTFTAVGPNPYVCRAHQLTMQGDINVNAAASPPPRVADGRNGTTPMTVGKLSADGADLRIVYDAAACAGEVDTHDILVGRGSTLPGTLGGTYNLSIGQSECAIGTISPFDWIASPLAPASGDFLWFVIVADDGTGTEGSWSDDGAGNERNGPGVGGSSGECGNTAKDTSNTCPP